MSKKYTIEVFDLKKNEKPAYRDVVQVYDEQKKYWVECQNEDEGFRVTTTRFEFLTDIDRYHRWCRLPILDKE